MSPRLITTCHALQRNYFKNFNICKHPFKDPLLHFFFKCSQNVVAMIICMAGNRMCKNSITVPVADPDILFGVCVWGGRGGGGARNETEYQGNCWEFWRVKINI